MKKTSEKQNKYYKIRILAAIVLLAVIGMTYFSVSALQNNEFFLDPLKIDGHDYTFENPNYDLDIFDIPEYNALIEDEFIRYSDGATTRSVFPDEYSSFSEAAQLAFSLVHAIQGGDVSAYNACFSEKYIEKEGKQDAFTMQQIYGVIITKAPEIREGSYIRTDIELEYKIRENNGTLRADMGSDAVKKQVLSITTNNSSGKPLIDSINTEEIIEKLPARTYNETNIALVACIAGTVNAIAVAGVIIVFIKTKRKISDAE